jgi:protein ImuB
VVVLEGKPPVVTVVAMNEAAAEAGIELSMTKLQASAYPVELRQRSPAQETSAHDALLDCAQAFSPRVEDTAADTVVLDIAGLERLFGPPAKLAQDLARRASELGLEANVAVAANPDAAIHAARGFAGITIIPPGKQAECLGELTVDVLQGAPDILETLDRWGVRNLRALAALPEVAIVERLGQEGLRLQKLARGAVERTLVPAEPPLKFEETLKLEHAVELLEPLAFILGRLLEQLCARLGARALATNELRLGLELAATQIEDLPRSHGDTEDREIGSSGHRVIAQDSITRSPDHTITRFQRTLRLPLPMLDSRLFLKLLQLELRAHPPAAPVVRVTLAAEPVEPRPGQGGLFLPATPAPDRLELTLARLAGIVGEQKLGAAEVLDTHRPDAFQMKRFAPSAPQGPKPLNKKAADAARLKPCPDTNQIPPGLKPCPPTNLLSANAGPKAGSTLPVIALRRFRPPLAATVEVRKGEPVRIVAGEIRGEVASVSGPWRNSGEWWKGEEENIPRINTDSHGSSWAREEWDIAVANRQGIALYRSYRDLATGAWFVEGIYD